MRLAGRLGTRLPATSATGHHLGSILRNGLPEHLGLAAKMGSTDSEALKRNQELIDEFRSNGGQLTGRRAASKLVLLTTIGARTGLLRTSPLAYLRVDDDIAVFATNGGGAKSPDWYHNVQADPRVIVETGTEAFAASAIEVHAEEVNEIYARQVENIFAA